MNQLSLFTHSTCDHSNLVERKEAEGSAHHARAICENCGKFIKWVPKPKASQVSIVRLLLHPDLEEWQEKFLKAIVYRAPTKSERIVIGAIQAKVGANQT